MNYPELIRKEYRPLIFSTANALFSSLGQSHFLALFSLTLIQGLHISNTAYGSMYAGATLLSAAALPFVGPLIDRVDIRKYAFFTGLGLIAGLVALNFYTNLVTAFLALFLLRLSGQGLCTHINGVCTARYFGVDRGKALSLTNIGFPVAEGILTPLLAISLVSRGLHWNLMALIVATAFLYLPIILWITRWNPTFNLPVGDVDESDAFTSKRSWKPGEVLRHNVFYMLLIHSVFPAFALSGFLVYQSHISMAKGWPLNTIAVSMSLFALGRLLSAFLSGLIVDAIGSLAMFPFYQLPLSLGFFLLWAFPHVSVIYVGLFLCGISVGAAAPIKSSMWAELYGIGHLGAIKSMMATVIVVVTALSPLFFGFMIDRHFEINLMLGLALFSLATTLIGTIAIRVHRRGINHCLNI